MAAQVTSIGIATVDGWRQANKPEDVNLDITVLYNSDEYNLLKEFTSVVVDKFDDAYGVYDSVEDVDPVMVGFNSRNFDHPYMGARLAMLRLSSSWVNHRAKRIDMMRVAGKKRNIDDYPSQDDYAEYLGQATEDEYDGSMMPDFFKNKEWEKINAHVRSDVEELAMCFVEDKADAMEHFYEHYDIDKDAVFTKGTSSW